MADRFDAVVLGTGPGGEVVSGKLLAARYVEGFVAWPLTAFLSTTTYLLAGAESAIAHGWDRREQR